MSDLVVAITDPQTTDPMVPGPVVVLIIPVPMLLAPGRRMAETIITGRMGGPVEIFIPTVREMFTSADSRASGSKGKAGAGPRQTMQDRK
jgi:hypothetical protein